MALNDPPKAVHFLSHHYPDKMSTFLKNEHWTYSKRGNDDEELDKEVAELLRIETNLFEYETPLCKEFKEFNYLLKIDEDVLTGDLQDLKLMKSSKTPYYK